jgi:hypothetical protein
MQVPRSARIGGGILEAYLSCLRGIVGSRTEEGVKVSWVSSSPVRLRQQVNRDLARNPPCSLAYVLPKRKIREMPDS